MVSVTAEGNWHLFVFWLFILSVLLYQNIYIYIYTPDQDLGHRNSFNRASDFGTGLSIANFSSCSYKINCKMLSSLLLKRCDSGKLTHTSHGTGFLSYHLCSTLRFHRQKDPLLFWCKTMLSHLSFFLQLEKNSATTSMKIRDDSNKGGIFQPFPLWVPQATSQFSKIAVLAYHWEHCSNERLRICPTVNREWSKAKD